MAFPAHRILFFLIYSPWKHRIRKAFQIRLVSYILILILLSPPPWVDGRPTGSSQHFTDSNTVQNTHFNTEQNTNGLSRFILDMYEVLNGNNRDRIASNNTFNSRFLGQEQMKLVHSADIVRSFYNRYPSELTELENGLSLNFDISTTHRRERVRFTEVRVWKSDITNSTLISLLSNKTISRQCLALNLLATKRIGHNPSRERSFVVGRLQLKPRDLRRREYLSIHRPKLTRFLARWPRERDVKLTLVISPHCRNRIDLSDLGISSVSDADHILLMYTIMEGNDGFNDIPIEEIGAHLRKRAARNTEGAGGSRAAAPWQPDEDNPSSGNPAPVTNCQRFSNVIDIEKDLGWNEWVIYPRKFDAFYCYGQCHYPIPSNYNSTNHALIQALIHISDPMKVPPVCCIPTEFQDISFLYRQNTSLILKKYKNMIALSCGCR